MLIINVLKNPYLSVFQKILEIILQTAFHLAAAFALSASYVLLFVLLSVFVAYNFGDHALGKTVGTSLLEISKMEDGTLWSYFCAFSLYYKVAICFGAFFPFCHYVFGFDED